MADDPMSTLVLFVVVMRHCVTLQHFHYCIVRFSPIASWSNYFIAIGFSESRKGYFDTLYALDGGKAPRSERPKAKVLIHKQVRQSGFSAIHNSMLERIYNPIMVTKFSAMFTFQLDNTKR